VSGNGKMNFLSVGLAVEASASNTRLNLKEHRETKGKRNIDTMRVRA
jgi:hypothetical protein